jgi:L,D-transpeptidase ErfK/SrfK
MYLGWDQYRIHGTNKPYAIGRLASSGCIRMYPEHIKALYPMVPTGTKVTVVDQPVKVGWIDDKMYVEVSPTMEQSSKVEQLGDFKSYEITKEDMSRITSKAGAFADRIDWESVRKAVREHRGYPVAVLDKRGAKGAHVVDDMEEKIHDAEKRDQAETSQKKEAMKKSAAIKKEQSPYKDKPAAPEKLASVPPANTKTTGGLNE